MSSLRNLFPPKVSTDVFVGELLNLVSLLLGNPQIERILILVDAQYVDRFGGTHVNLARCTVATPADITPEYLAQFKPAHTHV